MPTRSIQPRLSFLFLTLLALGLGACTAGRRPAVSAEGPAARPKLAVLLVFDQMRGDYPSRWHDLFGEGGLKRLTGDGAWFTACHYPYANTLTAAGHATLSTGCTPATHGIIGNEWYDVKAAREVTSCSSVRHEQVPPAVVEPGKAQPESASPGRLLVPTLADAMKEQFGADVRVVSLSFKDRSAVLPGGQRPDACYWADKHGRFVTSTYYRDGVHDWVAEFNRSEVVNGWLGKKWERLRSDVDYGRRSGPDEVVGEGKGSEQGRTFPHPFDLGPKKLMTDYYSALANSPFGNEVLLALAKKAIDAEKLGTREKPDFLSVSFSSNDLVGHTWGPDSQEVLDVTLRTDLIVKDLLSHLDARVGKGNYVVVLSADHGICPLPENARTKGHRSGRVDPKVLLKEVEDFLNHTFPGEADAKGTQGQWVEASKSNMIYLSGKQIARRGTTRSKAAAALARWIKGRRGIQAAYTKEDLRAETLDELARKVKLSLHPERSGDVTLVLEPYHFITTSLTGTTHGSPHEYDTHVPLVVMGPGVKAGMRKDRVSPEHAAVILAKALGIVPPRGARVKVPDGLFAR